MPTRRLLWLIAALTILLGSCGVAEPARRVLIPQSGSGGAAASIAGCPVFPADNIWNTPIDNAPVDPKSDVYIKSIGGNLGLHPDFGPASGIPYNLVDANQPLTAVAIDVPGESDPGPFPIPAKAILEGGGQGDSHLILVQKGSCMLYELFSAAAPSGGAGWKASSTAIWDLRSNHLRPDGWTSADAAGLPIFPGLLRADEIDAGVVNHALRFTAPRTRRAYVWPARHFASSSSDETLPPMGLRIRLKANFDISTFPPRVQVMLRGLKKYGMMLADNGGSWYIQGVNDSRWDDPFIAAVKRVPASALEVVDVSDLQVSPNSGAVQSAVKEIPIDYAPQIEIAPRAGATFRILLKGNITNLNMLVPESGIGMTLVLCQDDAGGRSVKWPANVKGATIPGSVPNKCSVQSFVSSGGVMLATGPGTNDQ